MKEVLILEDNKETREALACLVREVEPNAVTYTISSEEEAYAVAMKRTIDLFLIDIILHPENIGDKAGADFAQNIRTIEKYLFTPIIIVTALYDPKMHMYAEVHCYRFIEKPFDKEKVKVTIGSALQYHTENSQKRNIIFHVAGLLEVVPIREIIYIESKGRRLYVTTVNDNFCIPYKSCRALLEELDCDDFARCNRGTIVNMSYIRTVDAVNRYIYLKGNEHVLQIGLNIKKSFMEKFALGTCRKLLS